MPLSQQAEVDPYGAAREDLTLLAIRAAVDARIARTLTGKIALNNIAIPHIKRGLRGFPGTNLV
jgi:hypothetical protein